MNGVIGIPCYSGSMNESTSTIVVVYCDDGRKQ
jgi:hypothetical protein